MRKAFGLARRLVVTLLVFGFAMAVAQGASATPLAMSHVPLPIPATDLPPPFLVPPTPCEPDSGWTWTSGPAEPSAAEEARQSLARAGILAKVQAWSFGEQDSCGTFHRAKVDYIVTLDTGKHLSPAEQDTLGGQIRNVLDGMAEAGVGNVEVRFSADGTFRFVGEKVAPLPASAPPSTDVMTKTVYVLVFDPILGNDQRLSANRGWYSFTDIDQWLINFFTQVSHGQVHYSIVATTVADEWPEKIDGYRYTEPEYMAVINHQAPPHDPDMLNYNGYVNNPSFDICGRVNRGEIDEVWMWGAPYFGYWESTLVGPSAYWYNSPPVPQPYSCNRLIPIMGFSYERYYSEATEDFGHRTESTMTRTYGSWQENRTAHNWDRFALVKYQSPNYTYSGCGSVHYAPNSTHDYDWNNSSHVLSNCDDFYNYPDLTDPPLVVQDITCTTWGCGNPGYFTWWFTHFPHFQNCGPDSKANTWWQYLANPALANTPPLACPQYKLTGTVTTEAGDPLPGVQVTLQGKNRSAMTAATGAYSITNLTDSTYVVVPSKSNYSFVPPTRTLTIPPAPLPQDFVGYPGPTLDGVQPSAFVNDVATPLTITGSHFANPLSVSLNAVALTQTTRINSTTLHAIVPIAFPSGVYTVGVTNPNGQTAYLPQAVTIFDPPAVTITSPAPGTLPAGLANVTVEGNGQSIELYLDGTIHGTTDHLPATWSWSTGLVANGTHVLRAAAHAPGGRVAQSPPVTVIVNNPVPAQPWVEAGLANVQVTDLAAAPGDPNIVYAASANGGVFRSEDAGMVWLPINTGLYPADLFSSLAVSPADPKRVFVGDTTRGVYQTTNGGASWSLTSLTGGAWDLAMAGPDGLTIYALTDQVYRSTNGGTTWTSVLGGPWVQKLAADPVDPQIVYAGAAANPDPFKLHKSTNGGATWTSYLIADDSGQIGSIAVDPADTRTIYVTKTWGGQGAYKSMDGGITWSALGPYAGANSIGVAPGNAQVLYTGGQWGQVFRSRNGGGSWQDVSGGLPSSSATSLVLYGGDAGTVLAGLSDNGVWKGSFVPPTQLAIAGADVARIGQQQMYTATVAPGDTSFPITYQWQATNQATVVHSNRTVRQDSSPFTWTAAGTKVITVTATSVAGQIVNSYTVSVLVPPSQVAVAGPAAGRTGVSYAFTATVSPASVSIPLNYHWEATGMPAVDHNGVNAATDSCPFTWTTPGSMTVTVIATNALGYVTDQHAVMVYVAPATVALAGPSSGLVNESYAFTATVTPQPVSTPLNYHWQATGLSDVVHANVSATGDSCPFTWFLPGDKTVTVTVTNPWGKVANSYTIRIGTRLYLPLLRR